MEKFKVIFLGFVFLLVNFGLPVRASARFYDECRRRDALSVGQRVLLEKETLTLPFLAAGTIGKVIKVGSIIKGCRRYSIRFETARGRAYSTVSASLLRPID